MAILYEVKPLNYTGEVRIVSKLQADVENDTRKTNPIVDYGPFGRRLEPQKLYAEERKLYYEGETLGSKLTVACGSIHKIHTNGMTKSEAFRQRVNKLDAELEICVYGNMGKKLA